MILSLSQWVKSLHVTIQTKSNEKHFPMGLFIMLYKVALTFEYLFVILQCNHSNECYRQVPSCTGGTFDHNVLYNQNLNLESVFDSS